MNQEKFRQSSARLYADEMITTQELEDFDFIYFSEIYRQIFEQDFVDLSISQEQLLQNLKLAKDKNLTLAGVMLFGKYVHFYQPQFSIKATSYFNEDEYRDKEDINGKLLEQQKQGVDFVLRNLHRRPKGSGFNSPAQIEIPKTVILEAIANAVVHRDYFISAPISINIFPDKVEVISPGALPNTLTVENIKFGIHIERNPIILSFMARFPETGYSGRGSGIPRILRICGENNLEVDFVNDVDACRFKVVFTRPGQ